jgi:hypothetical protein
VWKKRRERERKIAGEGRERESGEGRFLMRRERTGERE